MKNLLRFLKVLAIHGSIAVVVLFLIILGVLYAIDSYTNHGEALSVPDFTGMSMKEVEQTCKKHHLRYEVIDSVYSNTAEKGTVVDQSPGVDFKVKENRRIFLTVNATCAERVKMPKVVGVSLRQATALLETYGLKIGNLEYVPDFATNYVLEQKYKGNQLEPGEMVEKWSEIDLVVGKQTNEKSIVPSVIGLSLQEAEKKITEVGFNIGILEFDGEVESLEDTMSATIWQQKPRHSEKIEVSLGSYVDIWLTTDSSKVQIPDSVNVENNVE